MCFNLEELHWPIAFIVSSKQRCMYVEVRFNTFSRKVTHRGQMIYIYIYIKRLKRYSINLLQSTERTKNKKVETDIINKNKCIFYIKKKEMYIYQMVGEGSSNQYINGIYNPRYVSQKGEHQIYPEFHLH